jgi:hypothetical protein
MFIYIHTRTRIKHSVSNLMANAIDNAKITAHLTYKVKGS